MSAWKPKTIEVRYVRYSEPVVIALAATPGALYENVLTEAAKLAAVHDCEVSVTFNGREYVYNRRKGETE